MSELVEVHYSYTIIYSYIHYIFVPQNLLSVVHNKLQHLGYFYIIVIYKV